MCGRATLTCPPEVLAEQLGVVLPQALVLPRFNLTPSQGMLVVRLAKGGEEEEAAIARWGLVPHWAKDASIGSRCAQARAETVGRTPAFRDAFRARRCLVVVDGYYEWRRPEGDAKGASRPHWVHRPDGAPFTLAGVWERWRDPAGGEPVDSCAVLTTAARGSVATLHHRMPVVVPAASRGAWLRASADDAEPLLRELEADSAADLALRAVSTRVNDPRSDGPENLEPAREEPAREEPQLRFRF